MTRLPIRVRLTLVFALAMAVVLAAIGAFVYARLGASLTEQLDESLEARAATLASVVRAGDPDRTDAALAGDDESFAQVLGRTGRILAGSRARALLSGNEQVRARNGPVFVERDGARLLAVPVDAAGGAAILVVGGSLEDRAEALDGLLAQLSIAGPVALLLSCLAGYLLSGSALRPVEAMRRRAEDVSAETPGRRLPLPRARDEVSRLGETLNAMLARLDAGLQRERRFVADASHELRTPLALLRTELELALRRRRSPEDLERALRSVAEEVDRLGRLADDLLVLASAEDGWLPVRRTPLEVRELLDVVAERFAARASAAGRPLEVVSAETTMIGDRLRLEQALGNLVDNALRYGNGAIRLEALAANGAVALRVSDEGAGFPSSFLPRAFERFSRADDARSCGATGLGLAIVAAIARGHGGEARARNLDGRGAEVEIVVPANGRGD